MYTLNNAFGVSRIPESRWQTLNLNTLSVSQIFQDYRKVYLTLTEPVSSNIAYVDLDSLAHKYSYFTGTINDLLIDNGNNTLVTIDSIPTINTKYSYYSDAFRAGYKAQIVGRNAAFGALLPRTDRKDIQLTRQDTNMQDVYNNCLVSVNGLLHITDTDGEKLYVLDGGKTCLKSRQNQIGIWSFKNIANVSSKPIYPDMIFSQSEQDDFSDRVYIKSRNSLENKTVWMSLGGYLVRQEKEIFFPVGNDTYCLNISRLPLLQRYYEALPYLDFSTLGLDSSTVNSEQISLQQFYSKRSIMNLLTLTQSFLIIIDKPELFTNKIYIKNSNLPGMFISYQEPKQPLFAGYGKMCEYWKSKEDDQWAVNVQDSYLQNKVFDSVTKGLTQFVSNNNRPEKTFYNSRGYLLEVGSDF